MAKLRGAAGAEFYGGGIGKHKISVLLPLRSEGKAVPGSHSRFLSSCTPLRPFLQGNLHLGNNIPSPEVFPLCFPCVYIFFQQAELHPAAPGAHLASFNTSETSLSPRGMGRGSECAESRGEPGVPGPGKGSESATPVPLGTPILVPGKGL